MSGTFPAVSGKYQVVSLKLLHRPWEEGEPPDEKDNCEAFPDRFPDEKDACEAFPDEK